MKKLFVIILSALFVFTSCNMGRLEWWEVVNTTDVREENASYRNDNSDLETYLFEKADTLESQLQPYRVDNFKDCDSMPMKALNIASIVFSILLLSACR